MKHSLVIFDFDGTIVDSSGLMLDVYKKIAAEKNISFPESDEISELRKLSTRELMKMFKIRFWQIPGFIKNARELYSKNINQIVEISEMTNLIRKIKDEAKIAIVSTNSAATIKNYLESINLNIFDDIIEASLFDKSRGIKKLMKKYNVQIDQTIYIGDETRDIEASKRAGVKCISVLWGLNHKDALEKLSPYKIASRPAELLELL